VSDTSLHTDQCAELGRTLERLEGESRRWQDLRRRVEQLERENYDLKRRGALGSGVLLLLLLGIVWWLAWPGKTLVAHWVRTDVVQPSRIADFGGGSLLKLRDAEGYQADWLRLWASPSRNSIVSLGFTDPSGAPDLTMWDQNGALTARVWNAPMIGLYANTLMEGRPQLELSLDGPDNAAQIVLRDRSGREIWHAP
jgi:hypothetical protein